MKKYNRDHAWMILMAALCLSFCVSEQTKVLGHKDEADDTKVARYRRSNKRILDHSCDGFDCSQKKTHGDFVTDEAFSCIVGGRKECDAVNRMIKDDWKEENNGNYAKLTSIGIFNRKNIKLYPRSYRSLNYSITLPHEDKDGLKATMIMTVINSENDYFYSQNPLYRVFNFSTSKLTNKDLKQPRVMNYPCVFGLDEMWKQTNYTLNITVIPYQASLLYYLHIYSQDIKDHSCPVNNGIAMLNLQHKLHVVFELHPYPAHYQLTLYKNTEALQTIEISSNQHEFKLEDGGQYSVGIRPIVANNYCNETLTKSVIWRVEVKQMVDKKQGYVNLAYIVTPIGIALFFMIAGIVFIVRRHCKQQMERIVDESSSQFLQDQVNSNETTIPYDMIREWRK